MGTAAVALFVVSVLPTAGDLDAQSARLLTEIVASGASSVPGVATLSSADVRRTVELEGERQLLGCEQSSESCIAEIAAAMGAALVLHGEVGALGTQYLVSINLLDTRKAASRGRVVVRGATVDELASAAEAAAQKLVAEHASPGEGGERVTVLVMDLRLQPSSEKPPPPPVVEPASAPMPWGLIAAGVLGAGAVGLGVVGAIFDASAVDAHRQASNPDLDQLKTQAALEQVEADGTTALWSYGGAGVLALGAAASVAVHMLAGE